MRVQADGRGEAEGYVKPVQLQDCDSTRVASLPALKLETWTRSADLQVRNSIPNNLFCTVRAETDQWERRNTSTAEQQLYSLHS